MFRVKRGFAFAVVMIVLCLSAGLARSAQAVTLYPEHAQGAAPDGVFGDYPAGWGGSSWQAPGVDPYTKWYMTPEILFGRSVTVGELARMTYWTKKNSLHSEDAADWYLQIYTEPYNGSPGSSWYGNRINAEPYFSQNLNAPANTWNMWDTEEGADNRLRFFDSSTGYFGSYTDGFLQDLTSDADYADQGVLYFSGGVGSAWADGFTGYLDGLTVTLADGSEGRVDFAAVPEPATMSLLALGIGGLAFIRKRRKS